MRNGTVIIAAILALAGLQCKKGSGGGTTPPVASNFYSTATQVNGQAAAGILYNVNLTPTLRFTFTAALNKTSVSSAITLQDKNGTTISCNASYQDADQTVILQPGSPLLALSKYTVSVSANLKSADGGSYVGNPNYSFITRIDSARKFPQISDDALLTLVQQQTFKYFWDFGHPVSGLARERSNGDNSIVTSGGSGFGIMAIPVGIDRGFITRAQGLARLQTIVAFLKNTAQRFHGAYPHWLNGSTGAVVPFSSNDNGADIVETSYLMMGLLTARQYFNGADPAETTLRTDINSIWQAVEWDWFRQGGKNVLYWNWSPNLGWAVNVAVQGWNECLITYVMAASSPTHAIPKATYDSGFARNGAMMNGNSYLGYRLPLGPAYGGPLFFSHYSFMGIKPTGLSDTYADYQTQTTNHSLINYNYCKTNPSNNFGYSDSVWGLTASDIPNGYTASSPTNDVGVIAPTAAVSSIPYTPAESMKAIRFFYYVLGDKLWSDYGFRDAFSLKDAWFAGSYLAIDQGPMIVMIENYRTGLLWNLFTSCPEIKSGMSALGFNAPYL